MVALQRVAMDVVPDIIQDLVSTDPLLDFESLPLVIVQYSMYYNIKCPETGTLVTRPTSHISFGGGVIVVIVQ